MNANMRLGVAGATLGAVLVLSMLGLAYGDDCHLTKVIHTLHYPGCTPRHIGSFACTGKCNSYVQVSGSKLWLQERSCMCCQESGEREAIISVECKGPVKGTSVYKRVVTKAPADCMCRPCTALEDEITPSDFVGYPEKSSLMKSFVKL